MKHLKTQKQLNEGQENLNISDVISSLTLEDITKFVNAFTDINIPIEAVREEIELNYL
jgi:L-cysteine desulfidase